MSFNIKKYQKSANKYSELAKQHNEITDYLNYFDNPAREKTYQNHLIGDDLEIRVSANYSSHGEAVRLIEDLGMEEANKVIRSILRTSLVERKTEIESELQKQFGELEHVETDAGLEHYAAPPVRKRRRVPNER